MASLVENADHDPAAVVAPIEHRGCQRHEPPQQIESLLRSAFGHRSDNSPALGIEIISERANALPIDKRARPANRREPFSYFLGNITWALRRRQLQSQTPLGGG